VFPPTTTVLVGEDEVVCLGVVVLTGVEEMVWAGVVLLTGVEPETTVLAGQEPAK
jgi:hypothetical protein